MACIVPDDIFKDVGIARINYKNQINSKKMQWDITLVDNKMIYDLFFGKDIGATQDDVRKLVKNPVIFTKIIDAINGFHRDNILFTDLIPSEDLAKQKEIGNIIKFRSIAMYEIVVAMESETIMEEQIGIKEEGLKNSLHSFDGSRLVNSVPIKQKIGKILLNQNATRLVGDPDAVYAVHAHIGDIAMKSLEKIGLISIQENSTILNPNYRDKDKSSIKRRNILTLDGYETVKINSEVLLLEREGSMNKNKVVIQEGLDSGNYEDIIEFDIAEETLSVASGISRLILPVMINQPLTASEAISDSNIPRIKDLGNGDKQSPGITEPHRILLRKLQTKRQRINPVINALMMFLHETLKNMGDINSISPHVTLEELYNEIGIKSKTVMNTVFESFIGLPERNNNKEIGDSILREDPIIQLIMYYPKLVDQAGQSKDFYHRIEINRTTHPNYLSTFLNEQIDKNFIGALVQGHPITFNTNTTLGQELYNQMIHSIIYESGLNIYQIESVGFDLALDTVIRLYREIFLSKNPNVHDQVKFISGLASGFIGRDMEQTFKSKPMTTIATLDALVDIRDAQKNDGKIITAYRTKLDTSGSSIMLSLMQNAGKDSDIESERSVISLLTELLYIKTDINEKPELKDAYHILFHITEKVYNEHSEKDIENYVLRQDFSKINIFETLSEFVKPMTTITNHILRKDRKFYKKNNLAIRNYKYLIDFPDANKAIENFFTGVLLNPLTTFISDELENSMGRYKQRVDEVYSHIAAIYLEEAINDFYDAVDMPSLGILPAITWHYIIEAGQNTNNEMIKEKDVYTEFLKKDPEDLTDKELSEFGRFHNKLLKKYKMPLTSTGQVLCEKNGQNVIYLTEVPDRLTTFVNTIDGLESGIDFKSHEDTIREIEEILIMETPNYDGEDLSIDEIQGFKTALHNAAGMIPDINSADPFYNLLYSKHYKNNSVSMSKSYDIEEQLALTYISMYEFDGKFEKDNAIKFLKRAKENKKKKIEILNKHF